MATTTTTTTTTVGTVDWSSTEGKISQNKYPRYDTKPSEGETFVVEHWGMWNTYT